MAPARHVIVAGAGIAGLTAALAMARRDRVTVFEQSEKLEEAGAGVQPEPRPDRHGAWRPPCLSGGQAAGDPGDGGGALAGRSCAFPRGRAGTPLRCPYWSVRGDLQSALADAVSKQFDVTS